MNVVFLVVFGVLFAGGALWNQYRTRQRQQKLQAIAAGLGLRYAPSDPFEMLDNLPFQLFDQGRKKRIEDVMWGKSPEGHDIRAFVFVYTTGSGKSQQTWRVTAGMIGHGMGHWPRLQLSPERFFSRLRDGIGLPDIQLESEAFNKTWEVRSSARRFTFAFCEPQMIEYLMEKAQGFNIEVGGPWMLVSLMTHDPLALPGLLDHCRSLLEHVPPVVADLYPIVAAHPDESR